MNTSKLTIAVILLLVGTIAAVHAQGDLEPPAGSPKPGMKTLSQIEPRIDLATVPDGFSYMHRIREPGSYYLSGNLDVTKGNGIQIAASGVTLDLNGFNIFRSSGDSPLGTAIILTSGASANIRIKNGHITSGVTYDSGAAGDQFTGVGFQHGIRERDLNPENVRVSNIHVSGCDLHGIDLGPRESNTVEHCSVRVAGGEGIRAGEVHHSIAIDCGSDAVKASGNVSHSRGESVGSSGDGIDASRNVSNSYGRSLGGDGIDASRNVSNSYGFSSGANGIRGSNVTNSYGWTVSTISAHSGIDATSNVSSSWGRSSEGGGISTAGNVTNSYGISSEDTGISASGNVTNSNGFAAWRGIEAGGNVSNSNGEATKGIGIRASNVFNSSGVSMGTDKDLSQGINSEYNVSNSFGASGGIGIEANYTVSYSHGRSTDSGIGLQCLTAIGCTLEGGESIIHKYLMQ